MPEIQAFRALLYRRELDTAAVVAPPYDVISDAYRVVLERRHPQNVVRLILPGTPSDAGYAEAGDAFRRYRSEGTLVEERSEALYVLEQRFRVEGSERRRLGLFARFRAVDLDAGQILPHERTRAAAKEDRWRMLQATRADFSPIFLIIEDPGARVRSLLRQGPEAPPLRAYRDDQGVEHHLWRVLDPASIAEYRRALAAVKGYIADGHHRYATALRYRDTAGEDGALTFGYFTPADDEGLLVLPYHRLLASAPEPAAALAALGDAVRVEEASTPSAAARIVATSQARFAFGLVWPSGTAFVVEALHPAEAWLGGDEHPSLEALDTFFVQSAVLPRLGVPETAVGYAHSWGDVEQALAERRCALALLMRATPVRQIIEVARARQSMPAKSTFFHPKLPSGLVIHPLVV